MKCEGLSDVYYKFVVFLFLCHYSLCVGKNAGPPCFGVFLLTTRGS